MFYGILKGYKVHNKRSLFQHYQDDLIRLNTTEFKYFFPELK